MTCISVESSLFIGNAPDGTEDLSISERYRASMLPFQAHTSRRQHETSDSGVHHSSFCQPIRVFKTAEHEHKYGGCGH